MSSRPLSTPSKELGKALQQSETTTPWSCPCLGSASHWAGRNFAANNGHCALQWPGLLHAKQHPGPVWFLNWASVAGIGLKAELTSVLEAATTDWLLGNSRPEAVILDLAFCEFCFVLALAYALIIFFSSSESSARSSFLYSCITIQP